MSLAIAASFDISGNNNTAQALNPAAGTTQTGNVTAAGDLNVSSAVAVNITGTGTSNLVNSGKIRQTGTARTIDNSGGSNIATINIVNNEGAVISSADGDTIRVNVAGSKIALDNSGSVLSANPSKGGSQALDWNAITAVGSNLLNNYATGLIQANAADAVRPGINGVIYNAGRIEAIPTAETSSAVTSASSSDGIDAQNNTGVQITNEEGGSVSGRHGITGGASNSTFTINVVNEEGATITGLNGSGINIDSNGSVMGNATVTNHGTIIGQFDSERYNTGDGDGVDVDGIVTLDNYGVIRGVGASGNGSDGLGNNPEGVSIGGGGINNYEGAEITGQNTSASGTKGHGILVDNSSGGNAFAATTIYNEGLIRGYDSYAIRLTGDRADSIVNTAAGRIHGAGNAAEGAVIQMGAGKDTLTNSGEIAAFDNDLAIDMGDGDDTVTLLGGSIGGAITGGAGSNSLVFDGDVDCRCALSGFESVEVRSGRVRLERAGSYSGTTVVSAGAQLYANAAHGRTNGTGALSIADGATLGGNGFVGSATVASGGTISPGDSAVEGGIGTLSIENTLTLSGGAHLRLDVSNHLPSDRLVADSLQIVGSGPVVVDLHSAGIELAAKKDSVVLASFGSASAVGTANFVLGGAPTAYKFRLEFIGTELLAHITNAPPSKLRLTSDTVQAKEKKGSAVFKVNRSGGVAGTVSVRYQTSDGTAIAGQDYEATSGTLEWADGDNSQKQIMVPIIDDALVEDVETFTMTLSDVTGDATIERAQSVASITSDDVAGGSLQFAVVRAPVDENAGTVSVIVSRGKSSIGAIGVHYSTANDTAIAGEDYTAASGDLNWADGDSADKIITVPITWDSVKEKNEQFTISLSSPSGGSEIGRKPLHTVVIRNVNR
ncbi:hypothetical protein WQQ_30010 [Hydrocarboniphaga effusa AP103]|uniref:Calx-beta domain-containing protein n=2 Tax=Nevskiaceae TaxID=568386 RepID=I7ZC13_9GAMM|nr:hypothetical protein WQQ_30010 [Hydrocarboniphaga effusa AP103]